MADQPSFKALPISSVGWFIGCRIYTTFNGFRFFHYFFLYSLYVHVFCCIAAKFLFRPCFTELRTFLSLLDCFNENTLVNLAFSLLTFLYRKKKFVSAWKSRAFGKNYSTQFYGIFHFLKCIPFKNSVLHNLNGHNLVVLSTMSAEVSL